MSFRRLRTRLRSLLGHVARRPGLVQLACLGALLLGSSAAFGRAGGGEHYTPSHSSGGGSYHSSGGSSGGSGDVGDLFFVIEIVVRLFVFTFEYPTVMVPVWIVFGIVVVLWFRSTPGHTTKSGVQQLEQRRARSQQQIDSALARLKQRDPQFDPGAFHQRTEKAFLDIQESWFQLDLAKTRHLMSDGLYRRFAVLLALMQKEGRRDAIADVRVRRVRVVDVGQSDAFDFVSVQVDASIRDTDVPAGTSTEEARRRALSVPMEDFSEVWTFVRRVGATSRQGFDLAQGSCPNCGAPFTGGQANKCEYCGAIVNSGNYDWVLSEITQPSEYLPPRRTAPGLDALRARDPNAAAELLEDRALLLFWKWLEAHAFGEPKRLQKLATAEALARLEERIQAAWTLALPAVGGADLAAVEVDRDGFDVAHVDVRWSGAFSRPGLGGSPSPRRHVVVMTRQTGVPTDQGVGLATERCGNCGAPLTNSDSTSCDYCGHDLASAGKEWQLVRVDPYESWQRPRVAEAPRRAPAEGPWPQQDPAAQELLAPLSAFAVQSERRRMLQVMIAIARADGVVDRSEERLLKSFAQRWQVPWEEVRPLLTEDGADPIAELRPRDPQKAEEFLRTLVQAARVDGRIDRRERQLLQTAADHLQAPPGVLDRLLKETGAQGA